MTHSKDTLIRASDYLDYDVDMLFATAEWLHTNQGSKSLIRNAILDSFLIHARNLIEFLSTIGYGNAVRAHHYFEDLPEGTYSLNVSTFLTATKDRISTHLAHLTTEPLNNLRSTIGWDIGKILLEIWDGLIVFYDSVPADKVLPDYDERYMLFKERIKLWSPSSTSDLEIGSNQTANTDFV